MSRALDQLSRSPFTCRIKGAALSPDDSSSQPSPFTTTIQTPWSILGPAGMSWFNSLKANSVDSYRQLTQAFGSCFFMNSRALQPLSALLSLSMRDGETLKTYSGRYWEMYNEMDGNFDDVAINTFESSLPAKHGLRKSLTGKPVTSMR